MISNRLHALGIVASAGYLLATLLSFALAPTQLAFEGNGDGLRFYAKLFGIGPITSLSTHKAFVLAYVLPLLLPTLCAAVLLFPRNRAVSEAQVETAYRWALVFALISCPSLPALAQDFWLSAAWGKMGSEGLNPYYVDMPQGLVTAWFPDTEVMRATYGPLWIGFMAGIMRIAQTPVVAFIVLKALLLLCWVGALGLVKSLTRCTAPSDRLAAIVAAGWLPAGVTQTVSEGHNDIAMVLMVLLWLRSGSAYALVAGIGCKYVVAPLALLELVRRGPWQKWLLPSVFGLGVLLLFARDLEFFSSLLKMQGWPSFLTIGNVFSFAGTWAPSVARVGVIASAAFIIFRLWKTEGDDAQIRRTLAVMAAVTFGVVSHLWPWYLAWVLLPAALRPRWWLSRFTTGLAMAAPFTVLYLTRQLPNDFLYHLPAVLLWGTALVWLLVTRPSTVRRSAIPIAPVGG